MMPDFKDPKFLQDLRNVVNKRLYTIGEVDRLLADQARLFDKKLAELERKIRPAATKPRWIYSNDPEWGGTQHMPLTSTAWDGDNFSDTAKTLLDLSTVFGTPADIKAILCEVHVNDSGSAAADTYLILSPNNTAGWGIIFSPMPVADRVGRYSAVVPTNANGDIFYQIEASGASTFDVILRIWGFLR